MVDSPHLTFVVTKSANGNNKHPSFYEKSSLMSTKNKNNNNNHDGSMTKVMVEQGVGDDTDKNNTGCPFYRALRQTAAPQSIAICGISGMIRITNR